jgi:hypothetical protein
LRPVIGSFVKHLALDERNRAVVFSIALSTVPAKRAGTPFRTALIALLQLAGFAAAVIWLPPVPALLIGAGLALAGVVLYRGPRWRTAALLLASLLGSFAGAEGFFGVLAEPALNRNITKIITPSSWNIDDPVVGYRPRPGTTVDVVGKFGEELVYHKTYTVDASGARVTAGSVDTGPTYLFMGDSYIFGEGLNDSETVPSQFAQRLATPGHVVNLGVLGYGPNHLVRAVESGLYDSYIKGKVAAVIVWSTPLQMPRVIGDGGWLGSSPRFELDASGRPRYTGSFNSYRLSNPSAGAWYLARTYLASFARAAEAQVEHEQADLYVALMRRLRDLVRERYGAPLVLIADWPDERVQGQADRTNEPTFKSIKALGLPMIAVRDIIDPIDNWRNFFIPHDGHPNAKLDQRVAADLLKLLDLPGH